MTFVAVFTITLLTCVKTTQQLDVYNGNICTVLCSGAASSVDKTSREPSSQEAQLYDQISRRQADIDLLKELVRNNSADLSAIRQNLADISHGRKSEHKESLKLARAGVNIMPSNNNRDDATIPTLESLLENSHSTEKVIRSTPKDCEEVRQSLGQYFVGRYYTQLKPIESGATSAFLAGCELREDAGWTIIQKRVDGALSFDKSWEDYKTGFGNPENEFWIGNEIIHQLTEQKNHKLRIELQTGSGRKFYAEYSNFKVASENDNYRLTVSGYLGGSAGDALTGILSHNGSQFSTFDRDNDKYDAGNCAVQYRGGWWFHSCFVAFLNGMVMPSNANVLPLTPRDSHSRKVRSFYVPAMHQEGIIWRTINKRQTRDASYYEDVAIKMSTMMITPRND